MRADLPRGTVTFVFTDVEGSTKLLHELGAETYALELADHRRVLRAAFAAHGGIEIDTQGDAFFVAFSTAPGAIGAAGQAVGELVGRRIRVRVGIHTGTPHVTEEGYVGVDVHRAARIAAVGHGGQVLVSAATATLVDGVALRDLGRHRLKDLSAPERIFQLGDAQFPPLKSLHQTNLPVAMTPFVGRDEEVREVADLVRSDANRLVTLTGPGGSGKTRLALQAAAAAADAYAAGVWWTPLAPVRDSAVVLDVVASALGARSTAVEHIGDRELLLILDNFEHVIAAATEIAELIRSCPGLTVLVTSRESLRIEGEREYAVNPMLEREAIALFESRARAVRRDFSGNGEIREICERLDHLPLAIELAAARVKVLSPAVLLERLERRLPVLTAGARDVPERQRTLRATIEWSHDLLDDEEQTLFRRLSVFLGGATLDAVESVCDGDLEVLASLVDKSLVRMRDDERFWQLETIREFALERLAAAGEAPEFRRRHAEYFLHVAEESEPGLRFRPDILNMLDSDYANLRAAFDSFESAGAYEEAARLGGALANFWSRKSHTAEARQRLLRLLSIYTEPNVVRADALAAAAMTLVNSADPEAAEPLAHEALDLHEAAVNPKGASLAEFVLGHIAADKYEWGDAKSHYERSAELSHRAGDENFALAGVEGIAWAWLELGEIEKARSVNAANLERARELGNVSIEAEMLGALGTNAIARGEHDEALRFLSQSLRLHFEADESFYVHLDVRRVAWALVGLGRHEDAAILHGSLAADRASRGIVLRSWEAEGVDEVVAMIKDAIGVEAFEGAWARGATLEVREAAALVLPRGER